MRNKSKKEKKKALKEVPAPVEEKQESKDSKKEYELNEAINSLEGEVRKDDEAAAEKVAGELTSEELDEFKDFAKELKQAEEPDVKEEAGEELGPGLSQEKVDEGISNLDDHIEELKNQEGEEISADEEVPGPDLTDVISFLRCPQCGKHLAVNHAERIDHECGKNHFRGLAGNLKTKFAQGHNSGVVITA